LVIWIVAEVVATAGSTYYMEWRIKGDAVAQLPAFLFSGGPPPRCRPSNSSGFIATEN